MAYKYSKYKPFRTYLEEYAEKWEDMAKLKRDENGILEVRFHTNDGQALFCEAMHAGYLGLLFDISHDPENEVVIITGTGDTFLALSDSEMSLVHVDYKSTVTYDWWYLIATRVPMAWLDIPVPVIAAVNGPFTIHPESVFLADYIIASDTAYTVDRHIQDAGCAPIDGINIIYDRILGPNASRALLMNGGVLDAKRCQELGVFAEVVSKGEELERAWEFARDYLKKVPSRMVRRMTRETFTQPLREAFTKDLKSSLCHECYSSELRTDSKPEDGHINMIEKVK
jgi:enoyl-CoA hydratase/carnithine racemase